MLIEAIKKGLEIEPPDRDPRTLSLSSAGHCSRQLAYRHHGFVGESLPWRALSIFSDGNYIQDQIRQWIHLYPPSDCQYLADEESETVLKTPKGREVKGHVDGVLRHRPDLGPGDGCTDASHTDRLLEIKSMGRRGFEKLALTAKDFGIEKSYLAQISCYLAALGLEECVFIAKCKDTSDLFECIIKRDAELVKAALARYDSVFDSDRPEVVQRMYHPSKSGWLPWQCGYCAFTAECWKKYSPQEKKDHVWLLYGDYDDETEVEG
jgi:hypothetical protein